MKILAVLGFLMGVMALFSYGLLRSAPDEDVRPEAIALNYAVFRNAVHAHVYAVEHAQAGDVPTAQLSLPTAWAGLRDWRARIEAGRCYVWGPASAEEAAAARRLFQGSLAVGRANNHALSPAFGHPVPLPGFIPENSLASVIALD